MESDPSTGSTSLTTGRSGVGGCVGRRDFVIVRRDLTPTPLLTVEADEPKERGGGWRNNCD